MTNNPQLSQLRNKHHGARCFIVGMGPSLSISDLDLLRGEHTFACNKCFLAFSETNWRPSYYCVEDMMVMQNNTEVLNNLAGFPRFFPDWMRPTLRQTPEVNFFRHVTPPRDATSWPFSSDPESVIYGGYSVTYIMMQLALFAGFQEIYLIGMDFNFLLPSRSVQLSPDFKGYVASGENNHFHPDYRSPGEVWVEPNLDMQRKSFTAALAACMRNGVRIFNATRGGQLEVFPRKNLDDLLQSSSRSVLSRVTAALRHATKAERARMAFAILAHGEPATALWNITTYYAEDSLYLLHVDRRDYERWQPYLALLPDNVILISRYFITVGGVGLLDATLDLLRRAVENSDWSRFCLLSSQDVALVPHERLFDGLLSHDNFIAQWNILHSLDSDSCPTSESIDQAAAVYGGVRAANLVHRFAHVHVHPDLTYSNRNHLGSARFRYHFYTEPATASLHISPLPLQEQKSLDRWFTAGKSLAFGNAWVTLNRPFANFCLCSSLACHTYSLVRNFLFPNEAFFQTVFSNLPAQQAFGRNMATHSCRSDEPDGRLTLPRLQDALRDNALFARKHVAGEYAELDAVVQQLHGDLESSPLSKALAAASERSGHERRQLGFFPER